MRRAVCLCLPVRGTWLRRVFRGVWLLVLVLSLTGVRDGLEMTRPSWGCEEVEGHAWRCKSNGGRELLGGVLRKGPGRKRNSWVEVEGEGGGESVWRSAKERVRMRADLPL